MDAHDGINRRQFLAVSGASLLATRLGAEPRSDKPNILLIIADQLVPFLTGVYGHPVVRTPHLDRLAKRGVRFDAAYTPCPICAPARACLLTGKYSSENGVYDNAAPLPCDEPTICHYLNRAGYDTVLSGKAHFVGPDQLHGFRKRLIPSIYPTDFAWTKRRENKRPRSHARQYIGKAVRVGAKTRNLEFDENAHRRAMEYLGERGGSRDPFFLCVSYNFPHEPFCPPKRYWDMYEDARIEIPQMPDDLDAKHSPMDKWLNRHHGVDRVDLQRPESLRRLRRAYYALITYIDDKVGQLLESLEENGLADDTVVIFTSDHGDMLCEKNMVQKRSFYEWSCRVPLIVAMPDGTGKGRRCGEPVSLIDLAPTILDLAGVEASERLPMDGASLLTLIRGEESGRRTVFAEMHSEGVYTTCFMVRRGRYKYNYLHGHGAQLFDLVEDPDEWNDLAGEPQHAAVEAELRGLILRRFDPDAIEKDLRAGLKRRLLLKDAMEQTGVDWEYRPEPRR